MKLPYLIKRAYVNKDGATWLGYYYQPPRGSAGTPGAKPKPVALGSQMVTGKGPHMPPADVLAAYAKVAKVNVAMPPALGTVQAIYDQWLTWARKEVAAERLGPRTLRDYEDHWRALQPVFGAGQVNALNQPVLLAYFDRRSSKDMGKREIAFLGTLCAWARARGHMVAPNPVDRGLRKQMKVPKVKAPTVSAEAYWVVWQCGDQLVRDTLDLAFTASTRPAEALRVPMPEPGATELEMPMAKTRRSGRASKRVQITPALAELIERRRAMQPHSLYVLFDERGQQLRPNGAIRSRLLKARDLAKQVCEQAGIAWVDFTLQRLRPTAVTLADKEHGRANARKLAGHTTEKQTAHYIRHEAELAMPAALPVVDEVLRARVEKIKAELAGKEV